MKITKNRIILFSLFLLVILFQFSIICPLEVSAKESELWEKQIGRDEIGMAFDDSRTRPISVQDVIINIIKVFLSFLALIFIIYIIFGGYRWMTAAGNEDRVKEAKAQIKNAIIGTVIIIMSYAITLAVANFIEDDIFDKL